MSLADLHTPQFVINCTQQAFIDFGSPCASSSTAAAFQTGCLAYSANYLQLYPAGTEASQYFKPLTEVAETGCNYNYNHSLPTCTPTVLEQIGWWAAVPPAQWVSERHLFAFNGFASNPVYRRVLRRRLSRKRTNHTPRTVLGPTNNSTHLCPPTWAWMAAARSVVQHFPCSVSICCSSHFRCFLIGS